MSAPAVLPPHASAADILAAAADVMDLRGKCEGVYTDERGRVCAVGALRLVVTGRATPPTSWDLSREGAYRAAARALRRWLDAPGAVPAIYVWSDSHSQQEVVAGLRAAAEHARTVTA